MLSRIRMSAVGPKYFKNLSARSTEDSERQADHTCVEHLRQVISKTWTHSGQTIFFYYDETRLPLQACSRNRINSKPDGNLFISSQKSFDWWTKGYLPTLQERQRWFRQEPNFGVGYSEGIVRQEVVRTTEGVYRRDVRKLCLLEEKLLSCIKGQMKPV